MGDPVHGDGQRHPSPRSELHWLSVPNVAFSQAGLLTNQNLRGGLSSSPGRQPWDKVRSSACGCGSPQRTVIPRMLGVLQFNSVLTLTQRECPTPQIRARSHRTAPTADSSHRSRWSTVRLTAQLSAVGSHDPLLRSDEFTSVVHRAQENILLISLT